MKQTAVEFLVKETPNMYWEDSYWADLFERAKEMDKQQKDDFAIGFAEWFKQEFNVENTDYLDMSEILEIYKKEKGL